MSEELFYIRDRRLPYHYTIDNEVYDMDFEKGPETRHQKEWKKWKAILVYNALSRHVSYEGETREQVVFSQKKVAEELDVGVTTVKNGLEMLIYNNLVAVEENLGYPNLYVLLEVKKTLVKKKYVRRESQEGSRNASTHTGGVDSRNASTPSRSASTPSRNAAKDSRSASTPNRSKVSAGMVFGDNPGEAKRENPSGKAKSLGAHSAQAPHFQDPYKDQAILIQRICDWHEQIAKLSKGRKRYDSVNIRRWATKRLFQIGLERMTEIYASEALGANPDIHTFWQKLKAEAEVSNGEVPKFMEDACGAHPLEVGI